MTFAAWLRGLEQDAPFLSLHWIDAGMVPREARGEVRIPDLVLSLATPAELDAIRTLELYTNQYWLVEQDLRTKEMVISWKFETPCITTLKEEPCAPSTGLPSEQRPSPPSAWTGRSRSSSGWPAEATRPP